MFVVMHQKPQGVEHLPKFNNMINISYFFYFQSKKFSFQDLKSLFDMRMHLYDVNLYFEYYIFVSGTQVLNPLWRPPPPTPKSTP